MPRRPVRQGRGARLGYARLTRIDTDPQTDSHADESLPPDELLAQFVAEHRARLVGALSRWCGDVQLAEDGFADAVERALLAWTAEAPRDPGAWIVTTARNRIRDILRSAEHTRTRGLDDDVPHPTVENPSGRDDDTLALMLACAHPSLDRAVHAPLILQVIVGAQTTDIATAFALPTATLAKRLVRAKQRLRADRDSFEVPDGIPPERVQSVLDAIYAAYSIEWLRVAPPDAVDLVTEQAIHASQLLLSALPDDHEVRGLAALLLYLHSRRHTRIRDGVLVPTEQQDPAQWDRELISHAERLLRAGLAKSRKASPGPYELQAAIQSAHASRSADTDTPWDTIAHLYDALILTTPSKGALVARAVAISRATDAATGLRILDDLRRADPTMEAFQPFHAARASMLRLIGDRATADAALERATALCTHPPSRRHLEMLRVQGD